MGCEHIITHPIHNAKVGHLAYIDIICIRKGHMPGDNSAVITFIQIYSQRRKLGPGGGLGVM